MTDAQLAEIEARLAARTPGRFAVTGLHCIDVVDEHGQRMPRGQRSAGDSYPHIARVGSPPNAELFANAPTDLAALLVYVRTLQSILGDLAQDPDGEGYRRALEQGRRAGLAEAERIVREQEALYPDTIRAALAAPRALRQAADTIRDAAGRPQP